MKKKRLQALCDLLSINDAFIDIGTDHAYVPIEMAKRGSKKILATDIHKKALEGAKKNIKKEGLESLITTFCTDGLNNIDTTEYDTLLIAGMGFYTIKHILSEKHKLKGIQKIILQSNNDWESLRKFMNEIGYALKEEKKVFENGQYYILMKYVKEKEHLSINVLRFGIYHKEDQAYYTFLINHYEKIIEEIPNTNEEKKYYISLLKDLKKYVKDCQK